MIDQVHPEQQYVVNRHDSIYKQARQKLYDWRARFKNDGTAEVSKELKDLDKETTKAVVNAALDDDGFAYFEDGDTVRIQLPFTSSLGLGSDLLSVETISIKIYSISSRWSFPEY